MQDRWRIQGSVFGLRTHLETAEPIANNESLSWLRRTRDGDLRADHRRMSGAAVVLPGNIIGSEPKNAWLNCAICGEAASLKRTLIRWYRGDANDGPVLASCVDCTLQEVARAVKLSAGRTNPVDAGKGHPVPCAASSTQAPTMQQPQMSLLPDASPGEAHGRATGYEQ